MRTTTLRWAAAAVAVATGVLGACSGADSGGGEASAGGDAGAATTVPADPTDVPAAASAGCDATATLGPGDERVTIESGGRERWYLLHVPEAHDGSTPVPLVLDLHGYAEGAEIHVQMSSLATLGDTEGFVTLTPQGEGAVPRWDTTLGGRDLAFVGDLLDEAEATLCLDTNRIYVTGLSNGAFMTSAVACQYADRVAAAAPVAGIRDIDGCDPARPVPVVAFHGTDDEFVAFDGGLGEAVADLPAPDGSGRTLGDLQEAGEGDGQVTGSDPEPGGPSVPEIVAAWAERNGCDPEPEDQAVADDVVVETYPCPVGADVQLYRIEGGGHTWPGSEFSASIEEIVGSTTMSISANEVMWEFFEVHPLADR
jgi:polyhydroxybutyrate depolymerase